MAVVSRMVRYPGAEKAADCHSVPSHFGVYDLFQDRFNLAELPGRKVDQARCWCRGKAERGRGP